MASAQPRASLHVELSAGLLPTAAQPPAPDLGPVVDASARVGVDLVGPLSLQLSGAYRRAFGSERDSAVSALTLGARFSPRVGSVGRAFVDLNVGPAVTFREPRVYAAFDVGAGFEFALSRSLHVGPMVRYSRLLATSDDPIGDAQAVTFGVSLSYYTASVVGSAAPPPPRLPPPERDTDTDADADGVLDRDDVCPFSAAGALPDPDAPGCPQPDRDHDSVPDRADACPDEPGVVVSDPSRDGCPASLVQIDTAAVVILQPVFFEPAGVTFTALSVPALTRVADALRAMPTIQVMRVEGHADDRLPAPRALALSQRRADAVVAWLVAHGIEPARLTAVAYGSTRPLGRNWTAATRARFNRVEFTVADPPSTPARTAMCPLVVNDRSRLATAFDGGPPDRDRDRVPDAQDHCPDVPTGAHPDPQCTGCPVWPMEP